MIRSKQQGWKKVEFESNCKEVVDKMNGKENDLTTATMIKDIRRLKYEFDECCMSFTRRENNFVSHKLAKFAINLTNVIEWKQTFLVWLLETARADSLKQIW